jgi:plastocyanin
MKLKNIFMAAAVIALVGAGCAKAPSVNTNADAGQNVNRAPDGETRARPKSGEMTVKIMPDGSFEPTTAFVKAGTKVTFVNTTGNTHRVASNPHPAHTDLPGFDSKTSIAPGASYTYTFDKVGRWLYHDHLNPQFGGAVEVME